MKKFIKIMLIVLLFISIIFPITNSYTFDNNEEKKFFEISKTRSNKR